MDPLTSLIVVLAALTLAVVLFWPATGLAWRWRRGLAASDRVEVEDALKHLWDGEYRQRPATLESLAGALGLSGRAAAELVDRLGRLDLLHHDDAALHLTADGRREALRVIRIHRLWERYLADETGLDAREWHAHAERREHGTSDAAGRGAWPPRSAIRASIRTAIRFRCRAARCRRIRACRSRS